MSRNEFNLNNENNPFLSILKKENPFLLSIKNVNNRNPFLEYSEIKTQININNNNPFLCQENEPGISICNKTITNIEKNIKIKNNKNIINKEENNLFEKQTLMILIKKLIIFFYVKVISSKQIKIFQNLIKYL
jgi:hypothetical protein